MKVSDIMTREPACCTPDDTMKQAAHLMEENDCGCIPIVASGDDNRVIGVVTDRDIAVRGVGRGMKANAQVRDVMTGNVCSCSDDADVSEVERLMAEHQIRRVVVVDNGGRCVGMVAQADLARAAEQGRDVSAEEIGRVVERISEPANDSWQPGVREVIG
jgi:CBS domain-containing protein